MKNIFFKSTLFSLAFLLFACSDTEKVIDEVFDNTTQGGILRTLESSTDLPIGLTDTGVELLLEVQDAEDGDLSDFIEVYASFRHITGGGANDRDEVLLKTVPNSEWIYGERLPRAIVATTLPELQAALNLGDDDFTGGDRFIIRVELVFKDGRRWSDYNASATVLGNLFFASPFVYNANVICPVPEEWFVGSYLMEKTSPEEDPFFPDFGQAFTTEGQVVNITANGTQRNFEFSYFPNSFAFGQNMNFTFLCGTVEVLGTAAAGTLGCGTGSIGQSTAIPPSTYDLSSDDVVIINLLDFEPDGGCNTGNYPVTLRFTKQ
jgi:hypothetical protein